jgi:hypothetical protein
LIADLDNSHPPLREVRQRIILVSFKHVGNPQDLLHFRIFPILKNWESYRCKATPAGKSGKLLAFEAGMRDSLLSDLLYVNEANAVGSVPLLAFLPNPRRMAQEINPEIETMIRQSPFRGVIQMDFPDSSPTLIDKIVQSNFP